MKKYYYQIESSTEEAEMMDGGCMLAIVEQGHFESEGTLRSEHILDDLVAQTQDPSLEDNLEELAESMFVSYLSKEETRTMLNGYGIFKEAELFPEE